MFPRELKYYGVCQIVNVTVFGLFKRPLRSTHTSLPSLCVYKKELVPLSPLICRALVR